MSGKCLGSVHLQVEVRGVEVDPLLVAAYPHTQTRPSEAPHPPTRPRPARCRADLEEHHARCRGCGGRVAGFDGSLHPDDEEDFEEDDDDFEEDYDEDLDEVQ